MALDLEKLVAARDNALQKAQEQLGYKERKRDFIADTLTGGLELMIGMPPQMDDPAFQKAVAGILREPLQQVRDWVKKSILPEAIDYVADIFSAGHSSFRRQSRTVGIKSKYQPSGGWSALERKKQGIIHEMSHAAFHARQTSPEYKRILEADSLLKASIGKIADSMAPGYTPIAEEFADAIYRKRPFVIGYKIGPVEGHAMTMAKMVSYGLDIETAEKVGFNVARRQADRIFAVAREGRLQELIRDIIDQGNKIGKGLKTLQVEDYPSYLEGF